MYRNALMVGFSFALPYHVMRCAAAVGLRVHVLGSGAATGLRRSRFCAGFHPAGFTYDMQDYTAAGEEIRRLAVRLRADVLLPSDDVSTRLLSAVGPGTGIPTSALPSTECFDTLNNKWSFQTLCVAHGVRTPRTWLYETLGELRGDIAAGILALPLTVKPTNLSGAVGVRHLMCRSDADALDAGGPDCIAYRPMLAQQFIHGREVGINVVCDRGRVVAHAIQERRARSFELLENADLLDNIARLAAAADLHGPANFDAIIESSTGLAYVLECNPRFWYTIYMSRVLGLDFVGLCVRQPDHDHTSAAPAKAAAWRSAAPGESVRLNSALVRDLLKPWTYRRADLRMLRYHLADPVPYWCEKRHLYVDHDVAVPHALMAPSPTHAAPRANASGILV